MKILRGFLLVVAVTVMFVVVVLPVTLIAMVAGVASGVLTVLSFLPRFIRDVSLAFLKGILFGLKKAPKEPAGVKVEASAERVS